MSNNISPSSRQRQIRRERRAKSRANLLPNQRDEIRRANTAARALQRSELTESQREDIKRADTLAHEFSRLRLSQTQRDEIQRADTAARELQRSNVNYRNAENTYQNVRRNLRAEQYDNYKRFRVGSLDPLQKEPPTADQLLFGELHALAGLHLYHHCTGHEFIDPVRKYSELR